MVSWQQQTPPSSLRDATAPNRGGLGKEGELYEMPRPPLLVGAVAAGDWGVRPNNSSLFSPLAAVVVVA